MCSNFWVVKIICFRGIYNLYVMLCSNTRIKLFYSCSQFLFLMQSILFKCCCCHNNIIIHCYKLYNNVIIIMKWLQASSAQKNGVKLCTLVGGAGME